MLEVASVAALVMGAALTLRLILAFDARIQAKKAARAEELRALSKALNRKP